MRMQPGGTKHMSIDLVLEAAQDKCDELERLAMVAKELRQRFVDVEVAVLQQGEVITDIEAHVAATRDQTEAVQEQLEGATELRRRFRIRWCIFIVLLVTI